MNPHHRPRMGTLVGVLLVAGTGACSLEGEAPITTSIELVFTHLEDGAGGFRFEREYR